MMRRSSLCAAVLSVFSAVALCAFAAAPGADPAPRMTMDDVAALLESGIGANVILRQIDRTGSRFVVTVDALLRLKAAGADDAFLEAIMDTVPAPDRAAAQARPGAADPLEPPPAAGESGFRIYTRINDRGEPVIHVTNLDASGRRIGGEVDRPAARNIVEDRPAPPGEDPSPPWWDGDDEPHGQPVVVSQEAALSVALVNAEPGPSLAIGSYDAYGGIAPGYFGTWHRHNRACGHIVSPRWSPYSPPGSYSHYRTYHEPGSTFAAPGPAPGVRVIDVTPYARGTAASRNRTAFRRH